MFNCNIIRLVSAIVRQYGVRGSKQSAFSQPKRTWVRDIEHRSGNRAKVLKANIEKLLWDTHFPFVLPTEVKKMKCEKLYYIRGEFALPKYYLLQFAIV